jgi:rRNA processing protein Gar1
MVGNYVQGDAKTKKLVDSVLKELGEGVGDLFSVFGPARRQSLGG